MKQGFSILEIIIGMMIGSMLLTQVFIMYNMITKTSVNIESITDLDTKIIILNHRLQKDLNGLCPLWFTSKNIDALKKIKKTEEQKETADKEEQKEKEEEQLFFYATEQDDKNLDFFTFISNNALQMYNEPNKYFVRIVYNLQKSQKDETFTLLRKEIYLVDDKIDPKLLKQPTNNYPVVTNIVSCKAEYGYIQVPEKKDSKDSKENKRNVIWQSTWKPEKNDTPKKGNISQKEKKPKTPLYVKIKLECLSSNNKKESFELFYKIPINTTTPLTSLLKILKTKTQEQKNNNLSESKIATAPINSSPSTGVTT